MNINYALTLVLGAGILLSSCGKNDTLDKQSDQRNSVGPALQGVWTSVCNAGKINKVTVEGDRMTMERVTYFETDCRTPDRTVKQAGRFELANTHKEGIHNSIMLKTDDEVVLSLHTDDAVKVALEQIGNAKKGEPGVVKATMSNAEIARLKRDNEVLASTKTLGVIARDVPMAFGSLQAERVAGAGLAIAKPLPSNLRVRVRYEVDNGYLAMSGPGTDYTQEFKRQ